MKRHILSYPKIIVSKNPRGGGGGGRVSIPGPWTNNYTKHAQRGKKAESDRQTYTTEIGRETHTARDRTDSERFTPETETVS